MANKSGRTKRPLCQVFYEGFSRARKGAGARWGGLKGARFKDKKKIPPHHF